MSRRMFPWDQDAEGLAPVLDDPVLWDTAFRDDRPFRSLFLDLASPRRRGTGLIPRTLQRLVPLRSDTSGLRFGRLLVEWLADTEMRKQLRRLLKDRIEGTTWLGYLGMGLLRYLQEQHPAWLSTFWEERQLTISTEQAQQTPPELHRPLVVLICAAALLSKAGGRAVLTSFWNEVPVLRPLLTGDPADEGEESAEDDKPAPEESPLPAEPPAPQIAPPEEDLSLLLAGADQWATTLPIARLREVVEKVRGRLSVEDRRDLLFGEVSAALAGMPAPAEGAEPAKPEDVWARVAEVEGQIRQLVVERLRLGERLKTQLQQELDRHGQALEAFDSAVSRLREQFEEVRRAPWLEAPLAPEAFLADSPLTPQPPLPPRGEGEKEHLWLPPRPLWERGAGGVRGNFHDSSLHDAQQTLAGWQEGLARVLRADSALAEVANRLGEPLLPAVPAGTSNLASIADRLEEVTAEFQRRFERLAEREKGAAALLDLFGHAAGAESGRRLVAETVGERWVVLAEFLLGAPPRTQAGRHYSDLVGDMRLVGMIGAHLWRADPATAARLLGQALQLTDDRPPDRWVARVRLTAHLSPNQVQRIGLDVPETAPVVVELLFLAALRATDPSRWFLLDPLLTIPGVHPAVAHLAEVGIDAALSSQPFRSADLPPDPHNWARPGAAALRQAWDALAEETDPACTSLAGAVRRVREEPDAELPGPDFGLWVEDSGEELKILARPDWPPPTWTWCWIPALTDRAVPLPLALADGLRRAVGRGPQGLAEAIEELYQQGAYAAALQAAASDPDLDRALRDRLGQQRDRLCAEHSELLTEADTLRDHDPTLADCLDEARQLLDEFRFPEALEWLAELEPLVRLARDRYDPRRLALLEFLREGKREPDEEAPLEELARQAEQFRQDNAPRRVLLVELARAAADPAFPSSLRESWRTAGEELDRPCLWPETTLAGDLGDKVQMFARFLRGRIQGRDDDPETADRFVAGFAAWLPGRLRAVLGAPEEGASEALEQLRSLAQDIASYRSEKILLRQLGEVPPTTSLPLAGPAPAPVPIPVRPRLASVRAEVRPSSPDANVNGPGKATEVIRETRAWLVARMVQEGPAGGSSEGELRKAISGRRWEEARQLAAALTRRDDLPTGNFLPTEAVYGLALAWSLSSDNPAELAAATQHACLAALETSRDDYRFYVNRGPREAETALRALLALGGADISGIVPATGGSAEVVGEVLGDLADGPLNASAFVWFRDLLWKVARLGDSAAALLADQLWESVSGEARSGLLRVLFRMRRWEALRHLTRRVDQIDDLIRTCLKAFEEAEADPAVRPQAREILVSVREQTRGKRNHVPWIKLFQHLEQARADLPETPVVVQLQSNTLVREGNSGPATVEVLLRPALGDPPRNLLLSFATDPTLPGGEETTILPLVSDEDTLLSPRTVDVTLPEAALIATGDEVGVSYQLTGETLLKRPIQLQGHWRFPKRAHVTQTLTRDELEAGWPGAGGNPVSGEGPRDSGRIPAFQGREREKRRIDGWLRSRDRMNSLMIFGQRRIGKTSLLLEMVRTNPPSKGRVAAAFLDVNSLNAESGALPKRFFEFVVSKLKSEDINQPIRQAVRRHSGQHTDIDYLTRQLRPDVSLEDALDGLVQALERASAGELSRMALFIDEFDVFVKPLMKGRREEVVLLHNSLRQIIQRSKRIALIIAGSGLQRLFTDDYKHPFYGSLEELELHPFDWEDDQDRVAIENTFLPPHLRGRLCAADRFGEVARGGIDLSGGHPYFLAMLGYAAARAWHGHPLTPALLRRVADLMIRDQTRTSQGGLDINPRKFYQPVMQSLERLPEREQAVAQMMLASIARLTSTEVQHWRKWKLIDEQFTEDPVIRHLVSERERLQALDFLTKERVVEVNEQANVRIRIPLTAVALREDARGIYDRAAQVIRDQAGEELT